MMSEFQKRSCFGLFLFFKMASAVQCGGRWRLASVQRQQQSVSVRLLCAVFFSATPERRTRQCCLSSVRSCSSCSRSKKSAHFIRLADTTPQQCRLLLRRLLVFVVRRTSFLLLQAAPPQTSNRIERNEKACILTWIFFCIFCIFVWQSLKYVVAVQQDNRC